MAENMPSEASAMNGSDIRLSIFALLALAVTAALASAFVRSARTGSARPVSPWLHLAAVLSGAGIMAIAIVLVASGLGEQQVTTPGPFARDAHGWSMAVFGAAAGLLGLLFLLFPIAHGLGRRAARRAANLRSSAGEQS